MLNMMMIIMIIIIIIIIIIIYHALINDLSAHIIILSQNTKD